MSPAVNHEQSSDVLVFEVAGRRHGVLLRYVVEVLRAVAVTKLLKAPPAVEGIINLRGTVIPVLDIRKRFGLPQKSVKPSDRMIVVQANRRHAVLLVDRIVETMGARTGVFDNGKVAAFKAGHIKGTVQLPEGLVLVYDLDSFLSATDAEIFAAALAEVAEA
jgi:purine-binding chemotaxis protein CheW